MAISIHLYSAQECMAYIAPDTVTKAACGELVTMFSSVQGHCEVDWNNDGLIAAQQRIKLAIQQFLVALTLMPGDAPKTKEFKLQWSQEFEAQLGLVNSTVEQVQKKMRKELRIKPPNMNIRRGRMK